LVAGTTAVPVVLAGTGPVCGRYGAFSVVGAGQDVGTLRAGRIPVRLTYLIGMPKECAA
jgi:hypothetical protein